MSSPVALPVPGTADLHIHLTSGSVRVIAEERDDVNIEHGAPSEDRIHIDATGRISLKSAKSGSANLELHCPTGSDINIGAISGAVELVGQFGAVAITSISGHVKVERAESLDVRCVSGSIEIGSCSGECRLQTKSGTTTVQSAGDTLASTISGRIQLERATGNVKMRTVSGSIDIGLEGKGDLAVETMSGHVRVEVPSGVHPSTRLKSLTGRPKSKCEEGNDCRISVRSLSGRIEVVPA